MAKPPKISPRAARLVSFGNVIFLKWPYTMIPKKATPARTKETPKAVSTMASHLHLGAQRAPNAICGVSAEDARLYTAAAKPTPRPPQKKRISAALAMPGVGYS